MTVKLLTILTGFSILISSCDSNPKANGQVMAAGSDTTHSPVETKSPNSNYKPAFAGQTRAAGVKTTSSFRVQVLSDKLDRPWGITSLPDGRFLITEKDGDMRIAAADGTLSDKIKGMPAVNNA
ncbi:MAG: PQQ-dependent sugar dehydrogenase, partial [Ginsengibacter sp.]